MATFSQRLNAANHDALDRGDDAFYSTNPTVDVGVPIVAGRSGAGGSPYWWSGFRFSTVTIPVGATITSAKLTFTDYANASPSAYGVTIKCEDADSAANFTTTADILGRTRTTASASWNTPTSTTVDTTRDTTDFASAVQEVVDRAGWASGNALMVILESISGTAGDQYQAYFYEDSTTKCALLTIEYTLGGGMTLNTKYWGA